MSIQTIFNQIQGLSNELTQMLEDEKVLSSKEWLEKWGTKPLIDDEPEHEHDYDERGICDCGELWEEDDFSGGSLGNDDR